MATVTVNFSDKEFALIKKFADEKGITPSELIRQVMFDWLEDEEDIRDAEAAYQEYLKNPVSYTLEEIEAELGLNEIVHSEAVGGGSQEVEENGLDGSGAYSKLA